MAAVMKMAQARLFVPTLEMVGATALVHTIRIAYILKESDLKSAIDILAAGIQEYRKVKGL